MSTSNHGALALTERNGAVVVPVRAAPRSKRDAVIGVHEGSLKVALTAPPVDGEANAALIAFLAKALGVPKKSITLLRGDTSRTKLVAIEGVSRADVEALVPR